MIRKIYRNLPKKRLFLPIRKKRRIKRIMAKQIHIHTVLKKGKGVRGETMPENDRLALASFGHRWNELARHEKMFLWTRCNYPIMFEFERPLTLANCRSITERISDWHDIERLMESIANRRDVLATHTSAIATFNSFARMDVSLRETSLPAIAFIYEGSEFSRAGYAGRKSDGTLPKANSCRFRLNEYRSSGLILISKNL